MRDAALSAREVAQLVGLSDARTVRRWTSGDSSIPYAAWALLCDHAGIGKIWTMTFAVGEEQ